MEKRAAERVRADFKVSYSFGKEINSGRIENLSSGGMFIRTSACWPLHSEMDVFVPFQGHVLKVPVQVRRVSKSGDFYDGMGVSVIGSPIHYEELLQGVTTGGAGEAGRKTAIAKAFLCASCRHVAFEQAPLQCPICHASIDRFTEEQEAVKTIRDFDFLSDFEKTHFPMVTVMKGHDSIQQYHYIDVRVKVGEREHGMDPSDRISHVDFYCDEPDISRRCIARVTFNCRKMNPESTLRLSDVSAGLLTVISSCEAHGMWMTEVAI